MKDSTGNGVAAGQPALGEISLAEVVGRSGTSYNTHDLRVHLKRSLPSYMVPAACVRLDSLPLNPNGKIDRQSLPPPPESAFEATASEPPRTPKEAAIAALWTEILGRERIGRDDNFFDLGGNSLEAVRMLASLRRQQGDSVTLGTLLQRPTPAQLAALLEQS